MKRKPVSRMGTMTVREPSGQRFRRPCRVLLLFVLCGLVQGCTAIPPFGVTKVGGRLAIVLASCRSLSVVGIDIRTGGKNRIPLDSDDDVLWSARSEKPVPLTRVVVLAELEPGWVTEGNIPKNVDKGGLLVHLETSRGANPQVSFSLSGLRNGFVQTWNETDVPMSKYTDCKPK
jgi:hypothetical protein